MAKGHTSTVELMIDLNIKDNKIVEFLVLLLDRQNQYYSDEIQMEINKIDSLL